MEHIRKAVERAKGDRIPEHLNVQPPPSQFDPNLRAGPPSSAPAAARDVSLNSAHLESKRIIAHDIKDLRSRSFDMLRTQILQSMDMRAWQFLGITSATEGCGKSVVAINLALSIARQPGRSVLLVDLDLQKPQVANYLGLNCDRGIVERFGGSNKSAGRPCSGAHPQRAGLGSALRGVYDKFVRMDCIARNERAFAGNQTRLPELDGDI